MPALKVDRLTKRFGDVVAVDNVSFTIEGNLIVTLLGPSGCGKSTILRCIAGLETPDDGEIYIHDELVFSKEKKFEVQAEKRNIGMVFQSYATWPHLTVFKNVSYGLDLRGVRKETLKKKVEETLSIVKINELADRYPFQLSGGQQQRVSLARALAYSPKLLLLDEPLANLDAKLRNELRDELREIQRSAGVPSIFVTHDQLEAMAISDSIMVLKDGRMIQHGTPKGIYESPENDFIADFIGSANIMRGRVIEKSGDFLCFVDIQTLGKVHCTGYAEVNVGQDVLVSIKPMKIDISETKPEGCENVWRGRVERSVYLGDFSNYVISVDKIDFNIKSLYSEFSLGQEVWIRFDSKDLLLIKSLSK